MSENHRLPGKEMLLKLPGRSVVQYAIRCALRAQPLLVLSNGSFTYSASYQQAVVELDRQFRSLLVSASADAVSTVLVVAENALTTPDLPDALKDAILSAVAATRAARTADANYAVEEALNAAELSVEAVKYARHKARGLHTASHFSRLVANETIAAIYKDFESLTKLGMDVTDASESGPLGDFWHGAPPEWYLKTKEYYDKTIKVWGQATANEEAVSETEPFSVYLDPGSAPPELITDLYIALDSLYRAHGGSGLEIVKEERRSLAGEVI
ncbi:hypothetical protein Pan241w_24350 [Gimesia alba]|uniref:Uncharacterized protein n=1 Tax=Gimesia alba TaxID=2527973 RepID=A0A517REQ5_9PLAN|nr:hypothetical protein [Gimesia alba]QDT42352.1 hypothetical protein Pan241w_24350 [Gimesia alba]